MSIIRYRHVTLFLAGLVVLCLCIFTNQHARQFIFNLRVKDSGPDNPLSPNGGKDLTKTESAKNILATPKPNFAKIPANVAKLVIKNPLTKADIITDKVRTDFAAYDDKYAILFNALQLDGNQINALKEIFIERDLLVNALAAKQRENSKQVLVPDKAGGRISITVYNEDTTNWPTEYASVAANDELEINNLLGADGYTLYRYYQATLRIRYEINNIQQLLSNANVPALDNSQVENFIAISYTYSPDAEFAYRATNISEQAINDFKQSLTQDQIQVVLDYHSEKAARQALIDKTVASAAKK